MSNSVFTLKLPCSYNLSDLLAFIIMTLLKRCIYYSVTQVKTMPLNAHTLRCTYLRLALLLQIIWKCLNMGNMGRSYSQFPGIHFLTLICSVGAAVIFQSGLVVLSYVLIMAWPNWVLGFFLFFVLVFRDIICNANNVHNTKISDLKIISSQAMWDPLIVRWCKQRFQLWRISL